MFITHEWILLFLIELHIEPIDNTQHTNRRQVETDPKQIAHTQTDNRSTQIVDT